MAQAAKPKRQNRTITVDFHDETTYFQLLDDGKAFVEFVLAFILSLGFQLHHKSTCDGGGALTLYGQNIQTGRFTEIYAPPLCTCLLLILDLSITDNQDQSREKIGRACQMAQIPPDLVVDG